MDELLKARAALLKKALDLINPIKEAGRPLTEEESAEVNGIAEQIEAKDAEILKTRKSHDLMTRLGGLGSGAVLLDDGNDNPPAKTLGEHFAKNADLAAARRGSRFSVSAPDFKAAGDTQVVGSTFSDVLTTFDTNIVTAPRRRLTVADLLGSETISGTAITYFVEAGREGEFGFVGENAQKPQLHYADPTPVTEALRKIAGFIKESDEIVEDLPWLVSAINGRLLYDLAVFEEDALLSGDGTGGTITGLLNRSGIQTEASAAAGDEADALFRAITKVPIGSTLDADGIVLNPMDYQALRLSKDGNGQYFGGGFFQGEYGNGSVMVQPPVWGLRTVVTPAIPAGTALVGAFAQGGSVVRKGGVSVEATNSHADDFTNNRITIRAEERLLLAVRRPAAFVEVTLTAPAG